MVSLLLEVTNVQVIVPIILEMGKFLNKKNSSYTQINYRNMIYDAS